jgi:hypothetical protein
LPVSEAARLLESNEADNDMKDSEEENEEKGDNFEN